MNATNIVPVTEPDKTQCTRHETNCTAEVWGNITTNMTSSSAIAEKPREFGDFKGVGHHSEAKFPLWADQKVFL